MLEQFPTRIQAGLSFACLIEHPDYAAPGWSVLALLRGPQSIDLSSVADGSAHALSADAATSSAWVAGLYRASIRVTDGVAVHEIEAGTVEIIADIAALDDGHDARSHAQKVLENIEPVIEGRATKDQMAYTINGRSLSRTPLAELLEFRKQYRKELASERRGRRPKRLLGRVAKVGF